MTSYPDQLACVETLAPVVDAAQVLAFSRAVEVVGDDHSQSSDEQDDENDHDGPYHVRNPKP